MTKKINNLLFLFIFFAGVALSTVYIAEYFFGIKPCVLCLYQRIPYFLIITICGSAIFLRSQLLKKITLYIALCLLSINLALSFYHSGVEQKIFKLHSSCTSEQSENPSSLAELELAIKEAPARCDEPNFTFLGLSLANWNFIYSLLVFMGLSYFIFNLDKKTYEKFFGVIVFFKICFLILLFYNSSSNQ